MKKYILYLCMLLLVISCAAPGKVSDPAYLFYDLAANYDISQYNITLETEDGIVYMTDAKLSPDGAIQARISDTVFHRKELVFYTKRKSNEVLTSVKDSSGNETGRVQFSKTGVRKILIKQHFGGRKDRCYFYNENENAIIVLKVFLLCLATVAAIFLLLYLLYASLFGGWP